MNFSNLTRLAMTVVFSAAIATSSFSVAAQLQPQFSYQWESEARQDKQGEKDSKKAHQHRQRLSEEQQQARFRQQQENLALYRKNIALQQTTAKQYAQMLQQQKRPAHYRFQLSYYERLRQQQAQLPDDRYDFNNDPFYYTAPNYRYRRDARSYDTNQYGADMLRRASNTGYQQGLQAGHADKLDNWRFDYKRSFAYEDANYGYECRYVRQDHYNHYFREGFQRGYEDGYHNRRKYGTSTGGSDSLLGTVLNTILSLETL
jgi:hypothetical protein